MPRPLASLLRPSAWLFLAGLTLAGPELGCQPSPKTESPKPAPRAPTPASQAAPQETAPNATEPGTATPTDGAAGAAGSEPEPSSAPPAVSEPSELPQVLLTGPPSPQPSPPRNSETGEPHGTNTDSSKKEAYFVAIVGDSLSDYRSGGGKFIRYLEQRCPESQFDNYAKGGAMVNQMRRRFSELFTRNKPHYSHVIIYGGVNDLYSDLTAHRTNDKIEKDLSQMYETARANGAQVVALTVSPWGGFLRYFNERRGKNTLALNAWILEQRGKLVDDVVDTYPLLSCGEYLLCPDYHKPYKDGLHLGPKGHERLGAALYEHVFHDCR